MARPWRRAAPEPAEDPAVRPRSALELVDVGHSYGDRVVLRDLSLVLAEHRVGVIGGNGSGKSTFARLLNGLVVPTSGRVLVDGLDTATDLRAVRRRVGFVFQDPDAQIVHPTVAEDVAFGLQNQRVPAAEREQRVAEVLDRYGLSGHADHPAHLLSGGQKQLLAIAGVLVMRPARVVFDEPTTLLDLANRRHVARVVEQLDQDVVMVTHDLDLLTGFDRVLVVEDGRVVADGTPAETVPWYVARMT
ncbi:energy-coupling factor ABC transporter ATP-binding protein [Modestobacter versicolor]|uniref:ABC transporter ATP-binding protein n=1 Tax=Modestobacter versicolor TaxID=429133 RepID=A0A323VAG6_9ACTN|nr:ATP-binding cassette domain-containing protein [Modestobacter versicolor]MBB3675990.1 biotin transport system ATP-binding protein [Modestobacter versicolor]PZA21764.1 ABC transporter ATP-binding protein [Modestobacter versicolor]